MPPLKGIRLGCTTGLVFTTMCATAPAGTIDVPAGDVQALVGAIDTANQDNDPDVINLAPMTVYDISAVNNTTVRLGPSGLPEITTPITIQGNGSNILRDDAAATPDFRFFRVQGGSLTLNGLVLSNGRVADYDGGAIRVENGTLSITQCTLIGNQADVGGAIWGSFGQITLQTVAIVENRARSAGGIGLDSGGLQMSDCLVTGNRAEENGGGIAGAASVVVLRSTISDNTAVGGHGGGINFSGSGSLSNCTISGNSAGHEGGGIFRGAGTTAGPAELGLFNCTIAQNAAPEGAGVYSDDGSGSDPPPTTVMQNTIVAGNVGEDCGGDAVDSLGHNMDGDGSCGLGETGDQSSTDPLLGALQDNGGLTPTHALLAGSPAIDAGAAGACPATDQRGVFRPQGGGCDMGAVEVQAGDAGVPCAAAPGLIVLGLIMSLGTAGRRRARPTRLGISPDGSSEDCGLR